MARPLRIEFPGAVYHVTSRGNARTDIFEDDIDRHLFLSILGQMSIPVNPTEETDLKATGIPL
jgi:hypothetical protein